MPPPRTTPRVRQSPELRRTMLLDATIAAVQRKGFDGVTVRDVASEAGVSSGLLHHYFTAFPELLAEAFARAAQEDMDELAAEVAAWEDPRERLDHMVERYAPTTREPTWILWISAWGAAPRHDALRATAARLTEVWTEQFASVLADGTRTGVFRCPDPHAAARRLAVFLDGLATQVIALGTLDLAEMAGDVAAAVAAETGLAPADFPTIASMTRAAPAGPKR
jgi:AcrR family transcriptional regulator